MKDTDADATGEVQHVHETRQETQDVNSHKSLAVALDHAREGYRNAQDIIKFIDTKSGVLTGLSGVTAGGVIESLKWFFALTQQSRFEILHSDHAHLVVVALLMEVSLTCCAGCFFCVVTSVVARPPRQFQRYTILFPFLPLKNRRGAALYYRRIAKGMSREEIAREYQCQITAVGEILARKVLWHRRAVKCFVAQVLAILAGAGMLAWLAVKF